MRQPLTNETQRVQEHFRRLYAYVKQQNYEGHDLFDGLNSRLFKHTPLYKSSLFRLALLQFCKRSPVNVRPLLMVPKGFDPSGGAFFLMGHLNMLSADTTGQHEIEARNLYLRLKECRLQRESGIGWGYNWDWQARAFFSPKSEPNLISSIYGGTAMLQYHHHFQDPEALSLAVETAGFILGEMIKFETEDELCFRYVPCEEAEVHNANLKAASYLASVSAVHPLPGVEEKIKKAVRFSVRHIREDYSWPYGTKPFHAWMDNFHTAYNIQSLFNIMEKLRLDECRPILENVIAYYFEHLFTEDGTPKYYNTALYPIDSHVVAEVLILMSRLPQFDQAGIRYDRQRAEIIRARCLALVEEFQAKNGSIYYLKTRNGWNRIPYIRWCQGKMFYALSRVLASGRNLALQAGPVEQLVHQ